MNRVPLIMCGALVILLFALTVIVAMPAMQGAHTPPGVGLQPYSDIEYKGRQTYVDQGCVYCHSQQVRSAKYTADEARGWGRPSVSSDYAYDKPHLLGTMRTGPDLINIGARQPSVDWHLIHLYQPRAVVPGSIMPGYPYLFETVDADVLERMDSVPDDLKVVNLPKQFVPEGKRVIAKPEALALVEYLLSLDRTFPPSP